MSVYEQEQQRMEKPARGSGGGGDFSWLEMDKPSNIGAKTYRNIRVVQRLAWVNGQPDPSQPYPEFWIRVSVHRSKLDGKWWMGVCPEDRDRDGWRDSASCPICLLQKELWNSKREDYDKVAKDIGARWRVYCNVIDLDDINGHWSEDGNGGWVVRPKVYGYSKGLHNDMMSACIHNGPIEDHQSGRPMVLECERTGPEKQNIRYRLTPKDRAPVPPELMPIVWGAYDLEGLAKPASLDELRKVAQAMDPRGHSSGATPTYASPAPAAYTAPPSHAAGPSAPPPPAAPAGPPRTAAAPPQGGPPAPSSYKPQGGYNTGGGYAGGPPGAPAGPQAAPPAPPAPAPAPPPAAPPPAPPAPAARSYHYSGPTGPQEGLSAQQVAQLVAGDPSGQHYVWTDGMAGWDAASTQPDIQQHLRPAQPAGGPPSPPAGPPGPPGPPGGAAF